MADQKFHIEVASDRNNLVKVDSFIESVADELNIDDDRLFGIALAISEAATNAIVHANKTDPDKSVRIDIIYNGSTMTVKVKDEGEGFNPEDIPDPTQPENLLKDSGRGLYLMKVYSDDIKYNVTDSGTETILKFKL